MLTARQRRLGQLLRAEISEILLREVRDPGIRGLVTITGVRVSADLAHATVFVSIYAGEEQVRGTLEALARTAPFVRALLLRRLDLRRVPELVFRLDDTPARAQRIEETIRMLQQERAEEDQPDEREDEQDAEWGLPGPDDVG